MNFKLLALLLLTVSAAYRMFLSWIEYRSAGNPTPENVRDVYDEETYRKWRAYHGEKCRLQMLSGFVSFVLEFVLIAINAYSWAAGAFSENVYVQALSVILFDQIVNLPISVFFEYRDALGIEEKYGFNRSTKKTFVSDQIKQFFISLILVSGLLCLFALLHRSLGDWVLLLFAAVLFLVILGIAFLYPFFSRIFNRFTPLADEELKRKLTNLLEKNGYKVREIKVMDASRRTSKSNAYFSGYGRSKSIVLYDTLLSSSTPNEICAVFAHEMGHGLHRDTLKNQAFSFLNVCLIAVIAWLLARTPEIYASFGFDAVNYGFAFLLMTIALSVLSPLLGLFVNAHSRKAEFRADRQSVKEGYGEALVSALKKLARANFSSLAPSPLLVKLEYSHPPLSERIRAIEELSAKSRSQNHDGRTNS